MFVVAVVVGARAESLKADSATKLRRENTTKDDVARLMHLFKDPTAIMHWSTLARSLTRRELDGRNSNAPSGNAASTMAEAADSYGELASIFNNYEEFTPQHAMLKYANGVKKTPYQVNSDDWQELAAHCWDIEPTNLERKNIIRDGAWVKEQWTNLRGIKYSFLCTIYYLNLIILFL
jgi:hypothetical protein